MLGQTSKMQQYLTNYYLANPDIRNGKSTENPASHVNNYHKITTGSNCDRIRQAYRQYSFEEILSQVSTHPVLEQVHSAFSWKDKRKDKCCNMVLFTGKLFVANHQCKVRRVKIHSWFYHLLVFFLQQLYFLGVLLFQGFHISFSVHGLRSLRKR